MPTALVIGASRGIGREFTRQLLQGGWSVWATARDDASLAQLQSDGAKTLKLDVTKTESIATLGWQLDGEQLDLALFVAGVYGPDQGADSAPTQAAFDQVMHANVLGAMQLIPTVVPMVKAGGKCVFLSSRMGSIDDASSSQGWVYRVSKAALNMAVKAASCQYRHATFAVLHPGWVQTDMGGPNALISPEKSVAGMLNVIAKLKPEESGSFRNFDGTPLPW
ncbi:NAD(P)-dependent dehydrogenase (short-subunit alcohol dehydrogenase family) [Paucimonas lemoignei]|uniref:NAD(P)-dependent dehydrogenase (Short-subunit alcohol dehydrogenase family) n=1 Tax=Paucimonas lemoignei TaxID=29443 RepID=A0A4R3HYX4_PAULE|nr:SDR family oxidoreductase [Paucimonas lemoignei]TCS37435.1 NAD(P)-dependent dehydrogenase (short-subunit alcohol dehydrogenase family) [Paucimonas lemoignei]